MKLDLGDPLNELTTARYFWIMSRVHIMSRPPLRAPFVSFDRIRTIITTRLVRELFHADGLSWSAASGGSNEA